jgi:hypothetical protein
MLRVRVRSEPVCRTERAYRSGRRLANERRSLSGRGNSRMFSTRRASTRSATLVFTLAIGWGGFAQAQMTGGPGQSSGTGSGTGAGGFTGVIRNRANSLSGVGPGSEEGDLLRGRPVPPLPGSARRAPIASFGPGVDVHFPNDPYLIPFMVMEEPLGAGDKKVSNRITTDLLKNARLIVTPDERSLALQRIANGAIGANQLTLAHQVLEEAITATSDVTIPLVRDQRLIAIVFSLNFLTEAQLREANQSLTMPPAADENARPEALPKRRDSEVLIRMARLEWQRSVYLASIIDNPTYRNEMLYKVAESAASGSATIANEFLRDLGADVPLERPSPGDRPSPGERPEPGKVPTVDDPTKNRGKQDRVETYKKLADAILIESFDVANKIDRLIWKYRAMVRIALLAADSRQFERGVELARGIKNGESRTEAMLILAEAMCRQGSDQNKRATVAYQAAAEAVASIHQDGLRGVLAGFLVDSLISTGRFDDARACVVVYPSLAEQLVALGAIAEQQGRRGGAEAARRWIANDIPEQYRPTLYRQVASGVLWTIEQNRSKEIPGEAPIAQP